MLSVQEILKLVQSGDRNAFGEVHRQMRIHMNENPDIGVFTQLYNKYQVDNAARDELNQDILVFIWEAILDGKLVSMETWKELKSYSSTVCKYKCFEYNRKKGNSLAPINQAVLVQLGITTLSPIDDENDLDKMVNDVLGLFTPRCREIWELRLLGKKNKELYQLLQGKFTSLRALVSNTSRCMKTMMTKAKADPRFSTWNENFGDFFNR